MIRLSDRNRMPNTTDQSRMESIRTRDAMERSLGYDAHRVTVPIYRRYAHLRG